jgi:hypothetical protein
MVDCCQCCPRCHQLHSVSQLVKCTCGATNPESTNKCSGRCSCKAVNFVCTELCNCEEDEEKYVNKQSGIVGEDIDAD